jgi:hypothetical protein
VLLAAWVLPALLVMLGAGLLVAAGSADARPPLAQCGDNLDNDADGRVDFPFDSGCANPGDPQERIAGIRQCGDGLDNDVDGRIDLDDGSCNDANDNMETNPPPLRACSNTLDDDLDGGYDFFAFGGFPVDPGCDWAAEASEADTQCSDGIDNDGDGRTDFPGDLGCGVQVGVGDARAAVNDNDETDPPQCDDGRDNDGDGTLDFNAGAAATKDPDCSSATDDSETSPAISTQCSDGVDNDGDTRVDYPNDPGCTSRADTDEADPVVAPAGADRLDKHRDQRFDLADPGCSSASDNDEFHTITFITPQGEVVSRLPLLAPFPIIRMRGAADKRGVRVSLLSVKAPAGSTVSIYCTGPGCPSKRVVITAGRAVVRARRFEKRLRSGTILKIYVTKPGYIGKYTRFRLLKNRLPLRADRCVTKPGTKPRPCPES